MPMLLSRHIFCLIDQGLPSFVVNNVVLRGGVSTPTVLLQTICSAYPVSPLPRICTDCLNVGPAQVDSCMNPPPAATAPSVMPGWASRSSRLFHFCVAYRRRCHVVLLPAPESRSKGDARRLSAHSVSPTSTNVVSYVLNNASCTTVQWKVERLNTRMRLARMKRRPRCHL